MSFPLCKDCKHFSRCRYWPAKVCAHPANRDLVTGELEKSCEQMRDSFNGCGLFGSWFIPKKGC